MQRPRRDKGPGVNSLRWGSAFVRNSRCLNTDRGLHSSYAVRVIIEGHMVRGSYFSNPNSMEPWAKEILERRTVVAAIQVR